uniref:Uncharacterized protein n=1 Tax=Oscillatoriales cyanobacterium SpSt-402 TaxID=2282168 RepID=A0A832H384_9CYAN
MKTVSRAGQVQGASLTRQPVECSLHIPSSNGLAQVPSIDSEVLHEGFDEKSSPIQKAAHCVTGRQDAG